MAKKKNETQRNSSIEKTMLENFVEIQKVMVDLSIKLGDLSSKISRLLDLFENTAKTMSLKGMGEENKEVIKKMDSLLEQNKTIAKRLSMMYESTEQPRPVQRTFQPSNQKPQGFPSNRFKPYPEK